MRQNGLQFLTNVFFYPVQLSLLKHLAERYIFLLGNELFSLKVFGFKIEKYGKVTCKELRV